MAERGGSLASGEKGEDVYCEINDKHRDGWG
jgi:hypothetical protein